jgi:competence protein ComEC
MRVGRVLRGVILAGAISMLLSSGAAARGQKPLRIYFVDVEGGQATLVVGPTGQSLLIDTGWPGFDGRDAKRIVTAAKAAHVKQLDYVLITHYHRDHVGGVAELAARMKIETFVDHGANLEDSDVTREDYASYEKVVAGRRRAIVKPGDGLPIKELTVRVLSSAGEHTIDPLPGAGEANPYCGPAPEAAADATENARSVGLLISYGKFRFIDLGDLTKQKELELACPNNVVGTVDLYLVTHHGFDASNAPALVWALAPRVAIMDNGAHKGGDPEAWQTVHDSPGLQDLWQLHYTVDAGKEHNVSEAFIANVDEKKDGNYIEVLAGRDGTFTVINGRNKYRKTYQK